MKLEDVEELASLEKRLPKLWVEYYQGSTVEETQISKREIKVCEDRMLILKKRLS